MAMAASVGRLWSAASNAPSPAHSDSKVQLQWKTFTCPEWCANQDHIIAAARAAAVLTRLKQQKRSDSRIIMQRVEREEAEEKRQLRNDNKKKSSKEVETIGSSGWREAWGILPWRGGARRGMEEKGNQSFSFFTLPWCLVSVCTHRILQGRNWHHSTLHNTPSMTQPRSDMPHTATRSPYACLTPSIVMLT